MRCVEGAAPYVYFINTTINRKREGTETLPYMGCADHGDLFGMTGWLRLFYCLWADFMVDL